MTPLRSCVARPSIGTGDTVAQGSLHCKEHRELQMPRPQCTQVAPSEAGAQRSVAPSTSVDSPCSSSCSNSAEDSGKSGRSGRVDLKNRTEKRRNRHVWMNCRVIRDREAAGSNPGPATNFPVQTCLVAGRSEGLDWYLGNAEDEHAEQPRSFFIPGREERSNRNPGDLVRLLFYIRNPPPGGPRAERMWLEVIARHED